MKSHCCRFLGAVHPDGDRVSQHWQFVEYLLHDAVGPWGRGHQRTLALGVGVGAGSGGRAGGWGGQAF